MRPPEGIPPVYRNLPPLVHRMCLPRLQGVSNVDPKDERETFQELLMETAWLWSRRSTCSRLQVGAVVARDTRILVQGYNGSPARMEHCRHTDDYPCEVSVHSEANCVSFAAKEGIRLSGASMYCTHAPCVGCAKLIINSGITKVVFDKSYRNARGLVLLCDAGLAVQQAQRSPRP